MVSARLTLVYGLALCATGWWVHRTKTDFIIQAKQMREVFALDESSKSGCKWQSQLHAMDEKYPAFALASFADNEEGLICKPYVEYGNEMYESVMQVDFVQSAVRTFGPFAASFQDCATQAFKLMNYAVGGTYENIRRASNEYRLRSELKKQLPKGIYQSELFQSFLGSSIDFAVHMDKQTRAPPAAVNKKNNNWKFSGKQVLRSYFKTQLRKENGCFQFEKQQIILFFVFADEATEASVNAACVGMFLFGALLLVIHSPFARARPVSTLAVRLTVILLMGATYMMDQQAASTTDKGLQWFLFCFGCLATAIYFLRIFIIFNIYQGNLERDLLRMLPPVALLFIRLIVLQNQAIMATTELLFADIGLVSILFCMVGDYTRFAEELAAARETVGVLFGRRREEDEWPDID